MIAIFFVETINDCHCQVINITCFKSKTDGMTHYILVEIFFNQCHSFFFVGFNFEDQITLLVSLFDSKGKMPEPSHIERGVIMHMKCSKTVKAPKRRNQIRFVLPY